jgi:hypothetical protein
MRVKFVVNLGSKDAVKLGLDHRQCVVDAIVEVSDEAGKALCAVGVATQQAEPAAPPKPPEVVKPVPVPAPKTATAATADAAESDDSDAAKAKKK